jgi:hypothetical protein
VRRLILALLAAAALLGSACQAPLPEGKYVATIVPEVYETAVFTADTLELDNPRDGKRVFNWELTEEGEQIQLTNIETGETTTQQFKYIRVTRSGEEREVVIIGHLIYYPELP